MSIVPRPLPNLKRSHKTQLTFVRKTSLKGLAVPDVDRVPYDDFVRIGNRLGHHPTVVMSAWATTTLAAATLVRIHARAQVLLNLFATDLHFGSQAVADGQAAATAAAITRQEAHCRQH
jgi:hypothetical protein